MAAPRPAHARGGAAQEPDAAPALPPRRAAHRPFRGPQPDLVRHRRRRGRRARRRAALADHPLPDHGRARRAAHRLAAPGTALGTPGPDPHRRPHGVPAAPRVRPQRRAGRVGDGRGLGPGPLRPHGSRRRQQGRGRTPATGAARPHVRRRLAGGAPGGGDRAPGLVVAAVRPAHVLVAGRGGCRRRSRVQPAHRGGRGSARHRRRRRHGPAGRDRPALGRGRAGRCGAARRRGGRIAPALRRALVRLPAHPGAGRLAAGAARPAHHAIAVGVARAAAGRPGERAAAVAGRTRRADPGPVHRAAGRRKRCDRAARTARRGAPARRRRPAGRSGRGHPRGAGPPPARRAPPAAHPGRAAGCGAGGGGLARRRADRSRVAAPAPGRRVARRRPLPRARPRAHRPAISSPGSVACAGARSPCSATG